MCTGMYVALPPRQSSLVVNYKIRSCTVVVRHAAGSEVRRGIVRIVEVREGQGIGLVSLVCNGEKTGLKQ
jgi:hypothetical protein